MDERGWGWSSSDIRQAQLVEWIAQHTGDTVFSPEAFYDALPDQDMNSWEVAHGDLKLLEARSLISLSVAMDGIRAMHIRLTHGAREMAEELRVARTNVRRRKAACRDAMVDWLHSRDATSDSEMLNRELMLADPRWGMWFAKLFSADDLAAAAGWLAGEGLVAGIKIGESAGPVHLYLTEPGVTCAERFDSDTARYLIARSAATGSGPTVNIGTNSAPFQVARDHAHQVQNIGASADELRKQIVAVAELVRVLVPGVSGIDAQQQTALAAARDGAVDMSVLQRFVDWVMSTVRVGATAAVVPAVTSATTALMLEAGRLTGHL